MVFAGSGENMIRLLCALLVWYFSFGLATTYGGIWHSQNHPSPNARVQFIGGETASGTLRRAWNRDWEMTKSDGSTLHFSDASTVVFRYELPAESLTFFQLWRAWVPVVVVSLCFLMFAILPGMLRITKLRRVRNKLQPALKEKYESAGSSDPSTPDRQ